MTSYQERLNAKVPVAVDEVFEERMSEDDRLTVSEKGTVLTRELEWFTDEGSAGELRAATDALTEGLEDTRSKKKSLDDVLKGTNEDPEKTQVQVTVPSQVKTAVKELGKEHVGGMSALVARVMHRYAVEGNIFDRLADTLNEVASAVSDTIDDNTSRKEEKLTALISELNVEDDKPFTLEEFDAANDATIAQGHAHARKNHLPKVLDELEYTWASSTGVFVPIDVAPDEERDTRTKPYELMDDQDKERAVSVAAFETVAGSLAKGKLSVGGAVDALHGRARQTTARQTMRDAAERPGFKFDEDDDALKVTERKVAPADPVREIVADDQDADKFEESDAEVMGSEDKDLGEPSSGWREDAIELLEETPDKALEQAGENIAKSKIARTKYPDEIEDTEISDEAVGTVTDDEIETVLEAANLRELVMDSTDEEDATDEETIRDEVSDAWDRHEQATLAAKGAD